MCMEGGGGLLLKIKRLTLRSHEAKTLEKSLFFVSNIPIFHSSVFHSFSRGGRGKVNDANFTLSAVFSRSSDLTTTNVC